MSVDQRGLAVIESDSVVVSMQRASLALAEAVTISQTKKIADVAKAAEIYAKRQHLSEEAERMAATVKVEALRKLGEMLQATPKNEGRKLSGRDSFGGTKMEPPKNDAPTLADLGLTKKESAVAQKLAALPEESFQQVRDGHVTIAKAIAAVDATKAPMSAPTKKPKPAKPAAAAAPTPEADADTAALRATVARQARQIDEMSESVRELIGENDAMSKVFEADDKLVEAVKQGKQLRAEVRTLRERVNGLMNEKNASIARVKSLMAKLKKAGLE